jgi:hypothetical protein
VRLQYLAFFSNIPVRGGIAESCEDLVHNRNQR